MARDIIQEIADVRSRSLRGLRRHTMAAQDTKRAWDGGQYRGPIEYIPIRLVTILETFTRDWITEIVDHGEPYITRAAALARSGFKIDYALAQALVGAKITFGELISHGLSVNHVGDLDAAFAPLSDQSLFQALEGVVDRWDVLFENAPDQPIVGDMQALRNHLAKLFEVRHILVHELPFRPTPDEADVTNWVEAVFSLTRAADQAFTTLLYGDILNQVEMNKVAFQKMEEADAEMHSILGELNSTVSDLDLRAAQQAWQTYRHHQAMYRSGLERVGSGSIAPLLFASEVEEITRARISQLRWFLDRAEGDL